ncbi:uncharacterized protein BYT42DRAFT_547995 [Radiomyces spectabilis]|uniref:uncharacterized protein n=1 Tax=Radiomyces spectabilis TaxID=64574 RepID=UPI00221F5341|nr:uncharacterized protein BYT42DRAFT_547995 [Radiomyces spectabilis]KAI8372982.1 hypothetical protein BYT42DRAFT_547995 [Radiomyces spectabilis]
MYNSYTFVAIVLCVLVALTPYASAIFGSGEGIVLYSDNRKTQSGILSSDHRCTGFPDQFPASYVKNTGKTHCAMWTGKDCAGSVYIVPAHYGIDIPRDQFQSVIC